MPHDAGTLDAAIAIAAFQASSSLAVIAHRLNGRNVSVDRYGSRLSN